MPKDKTRQPGFQKSLESLERKLAFLAHEGAKAIREEGQVITPRCAFKITGYDDLKCDLPLNTMEYQEHLNDAHTAHQLRCRAHFDLSALIRHDIDAHKIYLSSPYMDECARRYPALKSKV